jgi:hypothetical protein
MKNKKLLWLLSLLLIVFFMDLGNYTTAQTQRNPVLEEFTGTWCPWCPCGHTIMEEILTSMPNAIMIGYHGGGGGDPWQNFPGNQVVGMLGPPFWPSGTVDRTGAPDSRGLWTNQMNQRFNVPATVGISMDWSFNPTTLELNASVNVSALENLTGEYRMTMILLEDDLIYPQSGNGSCPGATDYVHKHVVRAMVNGATGEDLNGGNPWNTGEIITKNILYTVPAVVVPDNCELVVLVHNVQPALYNSEIQQAEKYPLIAPDYVAQILATSPDIIEDHTTPVQFSTVLYNQGLMDDMYYIDPIFDGPAGWTGEYTTVNGTFPFGQVDSLQVVTGESTAIDVTLNPNSITGYGKTNVVFTSKNNPGLTGSALLRNVTTFGNDILVIDADEDDFETYATDCIDNVYTGNYGVVSRSALQVSGVDLSKFDMISWSAGTTLPAFYQEEVNALQTYLDSGGNLFINGQDIGSDVFEPTGSSQFAQGFYNNYLHADYVSNSSNFFLMNGVAGDPITDGISFVVSLLYTRSLDIIAPFDADATPTLTYMTGPNVGGIRASANGYNVVYFGIGFELIPDPIDRDTIMNRMINFFDVAPPQLPSAPVLVSPANSQVIDSSSTLFVWEQSQSEVSRYWFELDTTDQFSTAFTNSTIPDTTFLFANLQFDKDYWWRVKAYNSAGWSDFSEVRMFSTETPVSVGDESGQPKEFSLDQNYPNPFNPSTRITYTVPKESPVTIKVYDLIGQEIAVLVNEVKEPGIYEVIFNALNLSSGVYLYQMKAGNFNSVKKMSILK